MVVIEEICCEVSLHTDNGQAAEYPDPDPIEDVSETGNGLSRTCHTYVESAEDAEFFLRVTISPPFGWLKDWLAQDKQHVLTVNVFIDGSKVSSSWCYARRLLQYPWTCEFHGRSFECPDTSDRILHRFKFAPVSTCSCLPPSKT